MKHSELKHMRKVLKDCQDEIAKELDTAEYQAKLVKELQKELKSQVIENLRNEHEPAIKIRLQTEAKSTLEKQYTESISVNVLRAILTKCGRSEIRSVQVSDFARPTSVEAFPFPWTILLLLVDISSHSVTSFNTSQSLLYR